jgi:hypothetical protein
VGGTLEGTAGAGGAISLGVYGNLGEGDAGFFLSFASTRGVNIGGSLYVAGQAGGVSNFQGASTFIGGSAPFLGGGTAIMDLNGNLTGGAYQPPGISSLKFGASGGISSTCVASSLGIRC